MQEVQSILVFDDENHKLPENKKTIDVAQVKSHRRPLGDICNVLQANKERNDRVSEKKRQKIEEPTIQTAVTDLEDEYSLHDPSDCSSLLTEPYWALQKVLDLGKRENEADLTEKLYGVTEYVDDIYDYLRKLERNNVIEMRHLNGSEMSEKMRTILVDWMIEVHLHFQLCQETLELGIYILDKFCDLRRNINKRNAQLIGLTSIFLAAKYEETEPLEIDDVVFVTDSAVSQKEIIRAERIIFKTLGYNLSRPLTVQFLRRYSKIAGVTPMEHAYATYFCDAALLEYSLCSVQPSRLASAALFLALCVSKDVIDFKMWNDNLIKHTTYKLLDFLHLLPRIATAVQLCSTNKLEAVRKKYARADKFYVSMMPGVHPCTKGSVIEHLCQ
ncbi:G2/mitotic-specific cyclin-B-like [Rhodnius prolixus]|uniref:G2/mitotic-specific cyclin-B-like n=1 Tax=Rhodnius prolixus TaxID=13249 RepID=UPI003D18943E